MRRLRVAVDTGGTFTDFVILDEESSRIEVLKVPSTRGYEADGIVGGLRQYIESSSVDAGEVAFFAHGTTVGTNALLEETGAKTGLLVTEGFRGIYEVGEQSRGYGSVIYDLFFEKPSPLVLPRHTEEIPERIGSDGAVLRPLDESATRSAIRRLVAHGAESIAVCLLFSFLNPHHEQRVREIVLEEVPDINISISSDVMAQIREYYRLSTTLINSYLNPMVESYVGNLDKQLRGAGVKTDQRYVMQSNGGLTTFSSATRRSVQTILSGPAAGVIAARRLGDASGARDAITFDMGGTSTDVALIQDGRPIRRMGGKVHRRDVLVPMLDIHTVAAGGGTLAWIDEVGVLQVGPRSAGAIPGPACYKRGGMEPTVTDANLVLGFLSADRPLAGGALHLDLEAAESAIRTNVAEPLSLSVIEAARGIIEIVDVKMQEAIKVVSSNRGYDLRDFHLIAFGGAGPLHAARIAKDLGMQSVLVPSYPGMTSSLGLLLSHVRRDYVSSELVPIDQISPQHVSKALAALEEQGRTELLAEGFGKEQLRFEYDLDLRYAGQGYELTVSVPQLPLADEGLSWIRERFDEKHEQLTGHSAPGERVELVSYRVTGVAEVPQAPVTSPFAGGSDRLDQAYLGEREVHFTSGNARARLYDRALLSPGMVIEGPAIILQVDSTTVLSPGQRAVVDKLGQIEIRLGEA